MGLISLVREAEGEGIIAWLYVSHCVAGDHVLPFLGLWKTRLKTRDYVYRQEEGAYSQESRLGISCSCLCLTLLNG